jgi:hypothetical protein
MMTKTEIEILQELSHWGKSTTIKCEKRRMTALDNLIALGLVHEVETTGENAGFVVMVKFGRKPLEV